jgi:ParB-like chromosome segregation protein Spo0J
VSAKSTKIEQWPTEKLIPYARNPRRNDEAVDRMAASIREFGFKIPILARSTGDIVDGHLRLKAAQKIELSTVPVLLCDEWTDAQVKAFRLMANRSANWAAWDEELLGLELEDLQGLDFDLELTGFNVDELQNLLNIDSAEPPSSFPEKDESIETEHQCPRCGFRFSGNSTAVTTPTQNDETKIDEPNADR